MEKSVAMPVNSPPVNEAPSRPPVCPRPWSPDWMAHEILRPYNYLLHALMRRHRTDVRFPQLAQVRALASSLTDIDEHLELMFIEALLQRPQLIVEFGVRSGTSTAVFEKVADLCGSTIISGDIEDCSRVSSHPRWHFIQGDDVQFAAEFAQFCSLLGIQPIVDLLFIDTSHYYEHTAQEVAAWFPLLSPRAKVMFHDTNLKAVGPRKDGCFQLGWNNHRGVIRAIEEYLGVRIDEAKENTQFVNGWLLRHWPNCNGLTILDRVG